MGWDGTGMGFGGGVGIGKREKADLGLGGWRVERTAAASFVAVDWRPRAGGGMMKETKRHSGPAEASAHAVLPW